MKKIRFGLLPRIIIAIVLGVVLGNVMTEPWIRPFVTFNAIFSQFLGFLIPIIIVGLVTPAIAGIGKTAGKMLLVTVAIAYADTVMCGMLAYGTGSALFPGMTEGLSMAASGGAGKAIEPYFTIKIPPILDVMSALVLSFIMGLGIAYGKAEVLRKGADEVMDITGKVISKAIIPLLPPYIFGIFLNMTANGEAYSIMSVFAKIIVVIFVLHIVILLYQFCVAGAVTRRNPLKLLWRMLPAYFTALGTSSSAATIPVTLRQTEMNGVSNDVAGFTVPLCATIHMSGSVMKITACGTDHMHHKGHAARRYALHGIRDATVCHDGGRTGSARRLHNGGTGTAGISTGIRRTGPGADDCAVHSHGQFRHGMQRDGRRSGGADSGPHIRSQERKAYIESRKSRS